MSDDKKESEKPDHVTLTVEGLDYQPVQIKIKKNAPMMKLMNAYCSRYELDSKEVRFRYDGQPFNPLDSPSTLNLEEGDVIEVFKEMEGGL